MFCVEKRVYRIGQILRSILLSVKIRSHSCKELGFLNQGLGQLFSTWRQIFNLVTVDLFLPMQTRYARNAKTFKFTDSVQHSSSLFRTLSAAFLPGSSMKLSVDNFLLAGGCTGKNLFFWIFLNWRIENNKKVLKVLHFFDNNISFLENLGRGLLILGRKRKMPTGSFCLLFAIVSVTTISFATPSTTVSAVPLHAPFPIMTNNEKNQGFVNWSSN